MLRSPESVSADTDRRSDRVGGAYGDPPFKVMFKTQLMLIHWSFHKQPTSLLHSDEVHYSSLHSLWRTREK